MKVFVLGLDGATWDVLEPLARRGTLPNLGGCRDRGRRATLNSVFPPLSPVAWTGVMTGKNSGKHGVFEFLEYGHDPLARPGELVAGDPGGAGLGDRRPARQGDGRRRRADELSASQGAGVLPGRLPQPGRRGRLRQRPGDPRASWRRHLGTPYRPWSTAVHDGGNEPAALAELTDYLDHHLKAVQFLDEAVPVGPLHVRPDGDRPRPARALARLAPLAPGGERARPLGGEGRATSSSGSGSIAASARSRPRCRPTRSLILMSDHGFGPIEWYVNFNVWLLEQGYIALAGFALRQAEALVLEAGRDARVVLRPDGASSAWPSNRVDRFRGKQMTWVDRLADSAFLSKKHIDWSKTKAYAQGNFGQIFLNVKGRQPQGCVEPGDVRPLLDELKAQLLAIPHPETGEPLVEKVLEREDLYSGPHAHLAPDLTAVLGDWNYRTIGLYDFTTNKMISPAFGPTGDHRMEGDPHRLRPGVPSGVAARGARPCWTSRRRSCTCWACPCPADMDGRVLTEILDPSRRRPRSPVDALVLAAVEASRWAWRTPRRKTRRSSSGWRTWVISEPGSIGSGVRANRTRSGATSARTWSLRRTEKYGSDHRDEAPRRSSRPRSRTTTGPCSSLCPTSSQPGAGKSATPCAVGGGPR